MYTCVRAHMYRCIYICVYIYMYMYMYIHKYICTRCKCIMYTSEYVCVCIYICIHLHMCFCVCICIYMRTPPLEKNLPHQHFKPPKNDLQTYYYTTNKFVVCAAVEIVDDQFELRSLWISCNSVIYKNKILYTHANICDVWCCRNCGPRIRAQKPENFAL